MEPISPDVARSILKIARELCTNPEREKLALSLQQYFEAMGQVQVADFFKRLKKLPLESLERVAASLSFGQVDSKLWLLRELEGFEVPAGSSVFILGGWHGVLALLMHWCRPGARLRARSIDVDEEVTARAASLVKWFELNREGSFYAATADMYELDYSRVEFTPHGYGAPLFEVPGLVVNTSCEHLKEFGIWWDRIPPGTRVALQTNNFFSCPEHVGCVASLEDFRHQAPLAHVHYAGRMPLENYDRFMLIGVK